MQNVKFRRTGHKYECVKCLKSYFTKDEAVSCYDHCDLLTSKLTMLVIGGAGYIGSVFSKTMINLGHKVIVLDNLSRGHFEQVDKRAIFIKENLLNIENIKDQLLNENIDIIYHFAAFAQVGESVKEPHLYYENNVEGVRRLLEFMRIYLNIPLVFSSSCAIFGVPDQLPLHEECSKNPLSPYGTTKLICEMMIKDYVHAYDMKASMLRYFNACGASLDGLTGEKHDPETHLIPNLINASLKKETVTINGNNFPTNDGTCIRDYIHVLDLADAHLLAGFKLLKTKNKVFDYFNLGSGSGYSNLEILETVKSEIGDFSYVFGPRREGDVPALFADNTKIKKELKIEFKYSDLKTIINTAMLWHKKLLHK